MISQLSYFHSLVHFVLQELRKTLQPIYQCRKTLTQRGQPLDRVRNVMKIQIRRLQ